MSDTNTNTTTTSNTAPNPYEHLSEVMEAENGDYSHQLGEVDKTRHPWAHRSRWGDMTLHLHPSFFVYCSHEMILAAYYIQQT